MNHLVFVLQQTTKIRVNGLWTQAAPFICLHLKITLLNVMILKGVK